MNTFILKIGNKDDYSNPSAIENTLKYIYRSKSTKWHRFYGVYPETCEQAIRDFYTTRNVMPNIIERQVWHLILSYPEEMQDDYQIMNMADAIAYLFALEYQVGYALHRKANNKHVHFIISTTSYLANVQPLDNLKMLSYLKTIKDYLLNLHYQVIEDRGHLVL